MIQWATARPVAYEFTTSSFHSISSTKNATNVSQVGAERGSSYTSYEATINQDGVTDGVTYSSGASVTFTVFSPNTTQSSATGGSGTQSGSTANSYSVTTTATTTMETIVGSTAVFINENGTAWTTSAISTLSDEGTKELTIFSTRDTSVSSFQQAELSTTSVETETTITNGQTALGNVFDTVFKDSNAIFFVHANAATDYDSILGAASALGSTTGTQVTFSHQVGVVPVSLVNATESESVTLDQSTLSSQVLTVQVLANSVITITDNIDPTRIPNGTAQRQQAIQTNTQTQAVTNQFIVPGGTGLSQFVVTETTIFGSFYTYSNFLKSPNQELAPTFVDGENRGISATFELFYPHVQTTYSTTLVETVFGPTVNQTIISAGGGQTTAITKQLAQVGYNQFYDVTPVYEAGIEEGYITVLPACAVYKPYGVYVGNELFLAASLTGTTLTGVQVAALSRGGIYPQVIDSSAQTAGQANQANRFILSYPDQSNDTFTINGKSVTYTKLDGSQITTESEEMVGTFSARTGHIGDRRWFGGEPEESATYYESNKRGVYVDQEGQTSFFTGGYTSYAEENRPLKIWQPIMAVGEGFGGAQFTARPAFPGYSYCFLAP